MKFFLIAFLVTFSFINNSVAQFAYEEAEDIVIFRNGEKLKAPFTSGFNSAQFCEMDLNYDGTLDLIVYDRSQGQVRPYVNLGFQDSVAYRYEPKYAKLFPKLRSWLLTADYNNDGKIDLFDGDSGIQLWKNVGNQLTGLKFEFVEELKTLYSTTSTKPIKIPVNSSSLPAIYDIDQDGDIDIFTISPNNGVTVDYHRNLSVEEGDTSYTNFERRNRCWGNFYDNNGSFELDDCNGVPIGGEIVGNDDEFIETNQELSRNEKTTKHGISAMLSPIDIDGNGSMDLIISDFDNYQAKLLLNEDSLDPPYVDSRIFATIDSFPNYDIPIDVLYPAVFFIDVNNDGRKDMIACPNTSQQSTSFPNTVTPDNIYYYKNISTNKKIKLQLQQRDFLIEESLDFGINAHPVFYDYNKDGLLDLVIGNDGHANKADTTIIGRLELYQNIGTKKLPSFELVDSNYLDIPSLKLDYFRNKASRNIIPTFGDVDGDGDEDLLLGEVYNNIFFFEDTSQNSSQAAFKFHSIPYSGLNIKNFGRSNAPVLYDLNHDEVLDLLVTDFSSTANYFLNFGTKTNPVFNIKLDSIIFQGNNIFRYYLEDEINFEHLKIGDSLSVNNGSNPNNNAFIKLYLTSINESENYIECRNTLSSPPAVDSRYNELGTDAYINFFNRQWGNLRESLDYLGSPRLFPYRTNGKTNLVVGSETGEVHFYSNINDSINSNDTFQLIEKNYLPNYGFSAFVNGADINDDGIVDLVIGNQSGGIKILIATGVKLPPFEVNLTKLSLGSDAANFVSFMINTEVPSWKIRETSPWMSVSPDSGGFSASIRVEATSNNTTGFYRTDTIFINSPPSISKFIIVTQDTIGAVGINEVNVNNSFRVFPNPTNSSLYCEFSDNFPINAKNIEVISLLGKRLIVPVSQVSNKLLLLNMNTLPSGIYYVKIYFKDKVVSRKVSLMH